MPPSENYAKKEIQNQFSSENHIFPSHELESAYTGQLCCSSENKHQNGKLMHE
jgi:hypothetical protein